MTNIIITGAGGLVGSRFLELTQHSPSAVDLTASTSKKLKKFEALNLLTAKEDEVQKVIGQMDAQWLVHFAGYTNVDEAELQRDSEDAICYKLNVEGTRKIVEACKSQGIKMVYISSDFVFDGLNGPYKEDDETAQSSGQTSWYGWTKLQGEKIVQESQIPHIIVRISYPYRANYERSDFVRGMIDGFSNGTLKSRFKNQILTPVFIDDFAKALDLLIEQDERGIWHIVNNDRLSAFDIAVQTAEVFGLDAAGLEAGDIKEFQQNNPTLAKRPANGGLKNDKINGFLKQFGMSMHNFKETLIVMKEQMEAKA